MCNVPYSRWQYSLCWFTNHRYTHREEENTCYTARLQLFIFTADFSVSTSAQNTSSLFLFGSYQQQTSAFCLHHPQCSTDRRAWAHMKRCLLLKCAQIINSCDHTYQMNWGPGPYFENVRSGFPRSSCFGWSDCSFLFYLFLWGMVLKRNPDIVSASRRAFVCWGMPQYGSCKKNEIKEIYSHKHKGQLNCLAVNWILISKTTERAEPSTSCRSVYKQKCCSVPRITQQHLSNLFAQLVLHTGFHLPFR